MFCLSSATWQHHWIPSFVIHRRRSGTEIIRSSAAFSMSPSAKSMTFSMCAFFMSCSDLGSESPFQSSSAFCDSPLAPAISPLPVRFGETFPNLENIESNWRAKDSAMAYKPLSTKELPTWTVENGLRRLKERCSGVAFLGQALSQLREGCANRKVLAKGASVNAGVANWDACESAAYPIWCSLILRYKVLRLIWRILAALRAFPLHFRRTEAMYRFSASTRLRDSSWGLSEPVWACSSTS